MRRQIPIAINGAKKYDAHCCRYVSLPIIIRSNIFWLNVTGVSQINKQIKCEAYMKKQLFTNVELGLMPYLSIRSEMLANKAKILVRMNMEII